MDEPVLLLDNPEEGVRRLTMNRPEKHNALNDELRSAIFDALREADSARGVSVIVIRGNGTVSYTHLTLPTILLV